MLRKVTLKLKSEHTNNISRINPGPLTYHDLVIATEMLVDIYTKFYSIY